MQNAKFPMEILRVTQGYGFSVDGVSAYTFSHSKQYALDLGGRDGGKDWLYAPFDCVVKRIYGIYNAVWFQSTDKVMCADGVARILVMMCIHMNNSDKRALGLYAGKRLAQGDRCYREGVAGYATGNHVHMEIGEGPFTGGGWHAEGSQWVINNKLIPSKVLFVGQDVIMKNPVYKWTIEKKEPPVTPPSGTFTAVSGKEIEIRMPLVPGFNDEEENLEAAGRFLAGLKPLRGVRLLPYHSFGRSKYRAVGHPDTMPDVASPSSEQLAHAADILRKHRIRVL